MSARPTVKMEWGTKEDLVAYIDDTRKRIRLSLLELTIMADAAGVDMVIEERDLARARDRLFEGERALRLALDMVKELPAKAKPRAWRAPVIDLGAKRRQRQAARGPRAKKASAS